MPGMQLVLVVTGLLLIVVGIHGTIYRSNKRNGRRHASWNLFEDLARMTRAELVVLLFLVITGIAVFFTGVSIRA